MTNLELRNKFLSFWKRAPRNHVEIPSSSLVPSENDSTTLFTSSGMQPLIPYLLGQPHRQGKRLVNIQKCFRGQDIDEVGDNRHDSFFEMMGNWSMGDYFKEDQLSWYWEFTTKVLGFDKEKLYVTCFAGNQEVPKDDESAQIWQSLGVPKEKIHFYGAEKNWWSRSGVPESMPVGEIGGPDSEVFYEFTHLAHDPKFGKNCHPNCDCGRFLEIGNSVFIQYQKQIEGSFKELTQKNVDFGGGLERTLAAINNNPDIFTTDLYQPIINEIEKVSEQNYGRDFDKEFRVIADHIKAGVFLVADGVVPSNKDRGYILRRLIRRALRFGRRLNISQSFLPQISEAVVKNYKGVYPELDRSRESIKQTIFIEEEKFQKTLDRGLREFEKLAGKGSLTPPEVFYLYESFGFPYELTAEEANTKKLRIPRLSEFQKEFQKHQKQSRTTSKGMFKGGLADHSEMIVKYHTATHLLHAALRKVLGNSVHQEGSNITGERLRFDFSRPHKLTPEEIKKVEVLVNEQITAGLERKAETMTYQEAIKSGALAFFKERYPEKVTVFSFTGPSAGSGQAFSREICGGPHAENTKILGKFKITKEESVSSGIRRIYAVLN